MPPVYSGCWTVTASRKVRSVLARVFGRAAGSQLDGELGDLYVKGMAELLGGCQEEGRHSVIS